MNFKKKSIRDLFLSLSLNRKISLQFIKKTVLIIAGVLLLAILFVSFEIYVPVNPDSHQTVTFLVQKGWSDTEIANALQKAGLIRSSSFFQLYVVLALKHFQLQAGEYNLSPKLSIHQIANKMVQGDIIREKLVILEGWDIQDIGEYLEKKGICQKDYFIQIAGKDYSKDFDFLPLPAGGKPSPVNLEGYLFPDTYEISKTETCEDILDLMLTNFNKKLTPELRSEIAKQGKSIHDIVIMASMIEKEGRGLSDKKIISDIFWKRLAADMPLQSCATVNYITGKNDPGISLADMQIDSPYNTYKYPGLPKGPISNPGLDSIIAAIYPTKTDYWYFLSNGKTIFSKTLEEHNAAKAERLK